MILLVADFNVFVIFGSMAIFTVFAYAAFFMFNACLVGLLSVIFRRNKEIKYSPELLNELQYAEYVEWAALNNKPSLFNKAKAEDFEKISKNYF